MSESNTFEPLARSGRLQFCAALIVMCSCIKTQCATLELSVNDEAGHPIPCRVLVRPFDAECVIPRDAVELKSGPDQQRPIPVGKGSVRELTFADQKIQVSVYDAELEHAWGAVYIQNLPEPLPLAENRGRPNLDYVRFAANAGAIVHYQGGWSRSMHFWAASILLTSVTTILHRNVFSPAAITQICWRQTDFRSIQTPIAA
jgi:hypothetical protein